MQEYIQLAFEKRCHCSVVSIDFHVAITCCRSVGDMDTTGSVSAVEAALDRLAKQRGDLEELWATRKMRLDLCLRLRLFERDALEVSK